MRTHFPHDFSACDRQLLLRCYEGCDAHAWRWSKRQLEQVVRDESRRAAIGLAEEIDRRLYEAEHGFPSYQGKPNPLED
mgnify:CR=1 FL=1